VIQIAADIDQRGIGRCSELDPVGPIDEALPGLSGYRMSVLGRWTSRTHVLHRVRAIRSQPSSWGGPPITNIRGKQIKCPASNTSPRQFGPISTI
jgi:hypothetical protein